MKPEDRNEFALVVRATFDNYGRQSPLPETLRVWWASLESFGMQQFRMACMAHIRNEPKFPPTLAQLLELMGHREPGRIGVEEAWALAVRACDESETVVLNDQIAEAWGVAQPIMALGDEVGARMAFKEAYTRIMGQHKGPTKWWPSIGNDPHKRDAALSEAKRAGLLPAPQVAALLPPAQDLAAPKDSAAFARFREEMSKLKLKNAADAEEAAAIRQREREEEEARKRALAERVAAYQGGAK